MRGERRRANRVSFRDGHLPPAARVRPGSEVIVVDLSETNAAVTYVLGLCHGLKRAPILITQAKSELLFNWDAMRCFEYDTSTGGLRNLREALERALRLRSLFCPRDPR